MSEQQLPADIVEYLNARVNDGTGHQIDSALDLLNKYAPEPKTLADTNGVIGWTCYYLAENGVKWFEIQGEARASAWSPLLPWPDIEGIDPRDLLNDGWQIRRLGRVPDDWTIATMASMAGESDHDVRRFNTTPMGTIVFCRPPQDGAMSLEKGPEK